jgi:hypothetical protein
MISCDAQSDLQVIVELLTVRRTSQRIPVGIYVVALETQNLTTGAFLDFNRDTSIICI